MIPREGPLWAILAAVGGGAALGAWVRWGLSYWLNPRLAHLPLGTLAANIAGGYLIGLAVGWFAASPELSPLLRLLLVTGFLGGLTTFSTFSAENVALMQQGDWSAALIHIVAHLGGSLLATVAGLMTWRWLA
ncbi:MAG: fluoride efflux transporter CrcB [Burkholderiaceae bacterium]